MQYSRELKFRRTVPYFGIGGRAMANMTKAKARKRLLEAQEKFKKVYLWTGMHTAPVKTGDMEAVEKIVSRCIKRIQ